MRGRSIHVLALVSAICGCGARTTSPVALEATFALPVGAQPIVGVVDVDGLSFIATSEQIDIYRGDIALAKVDAQPATRWTSLAVIDAIDRAGTWVVATDENGTVWRIAEDGRRLAIGERLAVDAARSILASRSTLAIVLDNAVAIADGQHVRRYPVSGRFAVGAGRLARATGDGVEVWDLARGTRQRYAIAGIEHMAFAATQLVAATRDALFVETSRGLERIVTRAVRGIAVGNRAWVLGTNELFGLDGTSLVPTTVNVAGATHVFSTGSSVWVARGAHVQRYDAPRLRADRAWFADVGPVFRASCAGCHLPQGPAGLDLSSPAAWEQHRAEIYKRVVVERSMPPPGTTMSAAARESVARWLHARVDVTKPH